MTYVNQKEIGSVKELANVNAEIKGEAVLNVNYRLIKAECPESVYLISVSDADEIGYIFAGRSESDARMMFVTLIEGEVTPCATKDVARDIIQINSTLF